ncbi:unnamed protein product, partial [Didymodactylos carnosus]
MCRVPDINSCSTSPS